MSNETDLKTNFTPPVVFISYKWADEDSNQWVEELAKDLRKRGIDALLDKWEVRLGESFSDYMTAAINRCDAFILIITKRSLTAIEQASTGGALKFEVQLATARRISGDRFRFIGILREGERPPRHLQDARFLDFRDDAFYHQALAELVFDLMGLSDKPALPTEQDLDLLAEPIVYTLWKGLPHGRRYLVEPLSSAFQERVVTKLTQLVKDRAANRGYGFYICEAEVDTFNGDNLYELERHLLEFLSGRASRGLKQFEHSGLTFKEVFSPENMNEEERRVVLIFRLQQWRGETTTTFLSWLRSLVNDPEAHSSRYGLKRITVILLAERVSFTYDVGSSPWWNVFEVVRSE